MTVRKKADYDYFKERVSRWVEYFGVFEYLIESRFEDIGNERNAEVWTNHQGRCAKIILGTQDLVNNKSENEYRLCKTAFHEVFHVVLAELSHAAQTGIGDTREEAITEGIIRRMENLVHTDLLRYWKLKAEHDKLLAKVKRLEKQLERSKKVD